MKQITFFNINTLGDVVVENDLYKHIHNPEMLLQYDSNFIEFKTMPSRIEFENAAEYLQEFHSRNNQKHVKLTFPANEKPSAELVDYMKNEKYSLNFLELYGIKTDHFPSLKEDPDIEITVVTNENLEAFLAFQYKQDLAYGREFADQKVGQHKRNFQDQSIVQLLGYFRGVPAGGVDVIVGVETAEIDGLVVNEEYQKKGIGSRLQRFVMNLFPTKTIILVADGEDTAREMYQKQNYQYLGFKYNVQKIYEQA